MPASTSREEYRKVHERRYALSMEWLRPYLSKGKRDILELGGASPFTAMLSGHAVGLVSSDLRYPIQMAANFWDVVLCMEVIEHVNDTDGLHTEWQGDGVRTMLSEAYRVCKRGGVLFLTTPNASSITALHHAMTGSPPMIFRPHVREYVPFELDELVRAAQFTIERRETLDVWRNAITDEQHKQLQGALYNHGYPVELRGEDIFLLARKGF